MLPKTPPCNTQVPTEGTTPYRITARAAPSLTPATYPSQANEASALSAEEQVRTEINLFYAMNAACWKEQAFEKRQVIVDALDAAYHAQGSGREEEADNYDKLVLIFGHGGEHALEPHALEGLSSPLCWGVEGGCDSAERLSVRIESARMPAATTEAELAVAKAWQRRDGLRLPATATNAPSARPLKQQRKLLSSCS